jgi:hypothetical protein
MLLLSQGRLSLIGQLDLLPHRWAALARGTTVESVMAELYELEGARFVAVDHDTQEVLVRTLVAHDLDPGRLNRNMVKGLWTSWQAILSPRLRQVAVDNLPEIVWAKSGDAVPSTAAHMRRSPRLEPPVATSGSDDQSQRPVPTTSDDDQSQRPVATSGSDDQSEPPSPSPSPSPAAAAPAGARAGSDRAPALSGAERQRRLEAAIDVLTDRHLAATPTKRNPTRHRNAVRSGKLADHRQRGHELLVAEAWLTPDELADRLEPTPDPAEALDPLADTQAAFRARVEREQRRASSSPPADIARNLAGVARARAATRSRPAQEAPQ